MEAHIEIKSHEQAQMGAGAFSTEALDEAASQGTEEALVEAQGSLSQSGSKAAALQSSALGEQLDLATIQAQAAQ